MVLQKVIVLTAEGYLFAHSVDQSLLKERNETLFDLFYSYIFQIARKISTLNTRSEYKC